MWNKTYDFDAHLAVGERLEILAMDPVFRVLGDEVARVAAGYGKKTKPAATDAVGMLVFGAATVLFGNDRAAHGELRYQWPLIRKALEAVGIPTSDRPPSPQAWRYFRKKYLENPELIQSLRCIAREMWLGLAQRMGMFPTQPEDYDWLHPDHRNTLFADGTWVRPASGVEVTRRGKTQRSRAKSGRKRLSEDVDVSGANFGYQHTVVSARLPVERMRLIIDIGRAAPSRDVKVALDSLFWAKTQLGDRLRHFAYDRALSAKEDITRVIRAGILPLCKPSNVDAFDDWKALPRHKIRNDKAIAFSYKFGECFHDLCFDAGMLWDMETRADGRYYLKRADHLAVRRVRRADGSYDFEVDLRLYCSRGGDHTFTWSLTGNVERLGKRPLNLAPHLRPIPIADKDRAGPALGIRQTAEAMFRYLKDYMGKGNRAGSFSALAHEIDMLLLAVAHNALVWREYCQEHSSQQALATPQSPPLAA